ncbi:MAG TPA: FUSC family membrane protein [Flavisolibacter sp.]|jgi:uncharacterized membrane protein (TIGR01666 family)|nr:FUSC family membrane protein [Flavisolibacter sp.]
MKTQAREIQHFFYSQAFADGIRTSIAVLLPALLGNYFGFFDIGLTISLGAACTTLVDSPGPIIHRKNALFITTILVFCVAGITSFARLNIYTMGLEIGLVTFFFSMFNVYGNRATSVGNAAILVMILTMDTPVATADILPHAFLILIGGAFYAVLSLLLHTLRPYRIAQRALADCVREIATYLSIRSDFYNVEIEMDENYKKLVAQQIVVNEKQDAARELFFKTRQIVQESTTDGRRLVFTFVETVDLFEDITASYYDYALLRKQFAQTGALELIHQSLKKIAFELDSMGVAIQANTSFKGTFDYDAEVRHLKSEIDRIAPKGENKTLVLRKILVNIRKMLTELNNINQYFQDDIKTQRSRLDHSHFVSHQPLDPKIFWNNLSLQSSAFRHSMRVCIASLAGFAIVNLISYGHHSYWVLMTIAFMLKPAFSLTKQRNIERIIGTFAGGLIGVLILVFIPSKTVHFVLFVLLMIGTYSFMRIKYLWMVICTTPYVLLLFSFLGSNYKTVVEERVFDTVLGCAIAFTAGYFLFPHWESDQLKEYMRGILKANAAYLQKIIDALLGKKPSMLEYKLARKEVYLNTANLSAAFQRMLSEPKSKQKKEKDVHQFVVLNHILFSNIATVATTLLTKETRIHSAELTQVAKKAKMTLCESSKKFGDEAISNTSHEVHPIKHESVLDSDDALMKEQLNFISKLTVDIDKTTKALID